MILPLSFLGIQEIVTANHCDELGQVVLDYFETLYIGELRRGRRLPPMFSHILQNMPTRVNNIRIEGKIDLCLSDFTSLQPG